MTAPVVVNAHAFVVTMSGRKLVEQIDRRLKMLRSDLGELAVQQARFRRTMRGMMPNHGLARDAMRQHLRPVPPTPLPGLPDLVQAEVDKMLGTAPQADGIATDGTEVVEDSFGQSMKSIQRSIDDWLFLRDNVIDHAATYSLSWDDLQRFGFFTPTLEVVLPLGGLGGPPIVR